MFLRLLSDDRKHLGRKLGLKLYFCVFLEIVANQEQ